MHRQVRFMDLPCKSASLRIGHIPMPNALNAFALRAFRFLVINIQGVQAGFGLGLGIAVLDHGHGQEGAGGEEAGVGE